MHEGNTNQARKIFSETVQEFQKIKETIAVVCTLEGTTRILAASGNLVETARLIGWVDATRQEIHAPRTLLEQGYLDTAITACISTMGKDAYADAYVEGQLLGMDEAVALIVSQA